MLIDRLVAFKIERDGCMKARILKRISAMVLATALMVGYTNVVSAGQVQATSSGRSFSRSWTATAENGTGSITYGYNIDWINEDFTWGNCSDASHTAAVRNGNGWHYGPTKSKGAVSKIEVVHKEHETSIKYQCNW